MSSPPNRSRCYVPFSRYHTSHVRTLHRGRSGFGFLERSLTLHSTSEEEISLMCSCMPFFSALVNNSRSLQKLIHSVASVGSVWTLRCGRYGSTTDAGRNYQKHLSPDGSIEDGLELHGRETFTVVALPDSREKTPRTESVASPADEMPESSSTSV